MRHDGRLLRDYLEHGDQAAFALLVERYLRLVYAACLRESGEAGLAEDAAQAVFLLLAHKAPALTARASLAGWLFAAARLVSRNVRRQERRRLRQEQKAVEEITRSSRAAEADAAAWHQVAPALNDALAALSGREREAVLLRFFQDLSLAETGAALGVSADAAQMRVSRAVGKLRRHLAKAGVGVSGAALESLLPTYAAPGLPASGAARVIASLSSPGALETVGSTAYQFSLGAAKATWMTKMKIAAVLAGVSLLGGYGGVVAAKAFSAARYKPARTSAAASTKIPPPYNQPSQTLQEISQALQAREQTLSRVALHWQIQSSKSKPTPAPYNDSFTQTWSFTHYDRQMLVTGLREDRTLKMSYAQYYEGSNGIIVNGPNTAGGTPVAPTPPQVWGDTGESYRWREPFQSGLNLTPEHFAMLMGINPLSAYGASWALLSTTPRAWTLRARVMSGLAPTDATAFSVEMSLSRRLRGAPARIVWTQGERTMTFQAQGFHRHGSVWVCDKMEVTDDYPHVYTIHQTWTLQSEQPSSPISAPVAMLSQVMDYRLIGLNLTTDDYLSAAQDRSKDVVIYPWPGRFPSLEDLKRLQKR